MAEPESSSLEDTAKLATVQERSATPPSQETVAPAAHATVPVRNVALYLLVIFAGIALLYWAKVVFIPLVLGFLWVGWDARKQGWHDKLAGTVVIKSR